MSTFASQIWAVATNWNPWTFLNRQALSMYERQDKNDCCTLKFWACWGTVVPAFMTLFIITPGLWAFAVFFYHDLRNNVKEEMLIVLGRLHMEQQAAVVFNECKSRGLPHRCLSWPEDSEAVSLKNQKKEVSLFFDV